MAGKAAERIETIIAAYLTTRAAARFLGNLYQTIALEGANLLEFELRSLAGAPLVYDQKYKMLSIQDVPEILEKDTAAHERCERLCSEIRSKNLWIQKRFAEPACA